MNTAPGRFLAISLVSMTLAACGGGERDVSESFQQVARTIVHGGDQVSVEALADWLIKDRQDFVLIDVRPLQAYEAGHIESAMSMPLTYLLEPDGLSQLPSDRLIVLYSNGIRKAAQAAVMLRLAGIEAATLLGGYNAWEQRVLYPELTASSDDELLEARKRQAIACYFAGNYKGGAAQAESQSAAFTPALISSPVQAATGATAHAGGDGGAIEEGC